MEQARNLGGLKTNSFVRLRKIFVDKRLLLEIEELGDAEAVLSNRRWLRETARKLIKRGISLRACCQRSSSIAASAVPTGRFLLVSLSKMSRYNITAATQHSPAASFPIKAGDDTDKWIFCSTPAPL